MKGNKVYNIDIFGLKLGRHEFEFEFDDTLFESLEERIIDKGQGSCQVVLEKKENMISMDFQVQGKIELTCDRSLESFEYPVELSENLILKYGQDFDDSNDEIWVIPSGTQRINIEKNIRDFVNLSVPMKRLHPRFEDNDESDEDQEVILVYESDDVEEKDNEIIDPRWAILKKIKESDN